MVLVANKKKSVPVHEKKRHGRHHKRTPDYHKPYWPYLPMALIVFLGILANTFWGTIQHSILGYATDMSISGLLQETNKHRADNGLPGLTLNDQLTQAAQAKAEDMAARDYWSHNTPEGNPPWIFFTNAGYQYQTAGENLAYGFLNSSATVEGWMGSEGHRANILNATYKEVGFGIANSPNYQGTGPETIVVAMYGCRSACTLTAVVPTAETPSTPASKPTQPETPAPKPEPKPEPKEEMTLTPVVAVEEKKDDKDNTAPAAAVTTKRIARIQLLSGATAAWSAFAVSAIASVAIAVFFLRHGLMLRRALVKGEAFIHKHPVLDITIVAVATIGIILTQTAGIIR
ncbi:CAP domain-containing protein [Candidatus Saccharibacteria bacterium]|nr:CAP domain-containing protein [Candidatus Saccharibacteria bacterium]